MIEAQLKRRPRHKNPRAVRGVFEDSLRHLSRLDGRQSDALFVVAEVAFEQTCGVVAADNARAVIDEDGEGPARLGLGGDPQS